MEELVQSILWGWDKMLTEYEAGRRPINPSRNWQGENGRKEKTRKKNNWYKTGGYSTVIVYAWRRTCQEMERNRG